MLVNNAGIQYVANVEDFPVEKWDAIIAINLSSAFHTTRLVLPRMRTNNWGRIINLASCTAWWPRPASRPTWPPSTG
jgi:3-hydroxybutyrate dehydrogenase